jgi:hypothetical protein
MDHNSEAVSHTTCEQTKLSTKQHLKCKVHTACTQRRTVGSRTIPPNVTFFRNPRINTYFTKAVRGTSDGLIMLHRWRRWKQTSKMVFVPAAGGNSVGALRIKRGVGGHYRKSAPEPIQ